MSRDVIDFNEQVYRTALELAEARGASEDTLQGLATVFDQSSDEHMDKDTLEEMQAILTGGSEARNSVAEVLAELQGRTYTLIVEPRGDVWGRGALPERGSVFNQERMIIGVRYSGRIILDVLGGYPERTKQATLPTTRILATCYHSYVSGTKFVYSLWVTAYLTVLAQDILQYNIPTNVPFMDEEG